MISNRGILCLVAQLTGLFDCYQRTLCTMRPRVFVLGKGINCCDILWCMKYWAGSILVRNVIGFSNLPQVVSATLFVWGPKPFSRWKSAYLQMLDMLGRTLILLWRHEPTDNASSCTYVLLAQFLEFDHYVCTHTKPQRPPRFFALTHI